MQNRTIWLALSALAGFLAVGIPYWRIPYDSVNANLPDALLQPGLFLVGALALLLCLFGIASFWRSTWWMTSSVVAAVFIRIVFGVIQDPTSHNLWPLEVIIALVVGLAAAIPGAGVGSLLARGFADSRTRR